MFSKYPQGFKQFLTKSLLFIFLFIIITGIIGSWIIPTKLLYPYYFFIYGNVGKLIIFSSILFILFTKDSLKKISYISYNKAYTILIPLSFFLLPIFYFGSKQLLQTKTFTDNITLSLTMHLLAIGIILILFLGIFGISYIKYFISHYKKTLIYCIGIATVFYFAIFQVWKLWPYFSFIVLKAVKWLLTLSFSPVLELPPRTLYAQGFSVAIEQACSGVDSLFLFSSLYIIIGVLDRKKLNIKKYILFGIPALIGLFLINILRVYILILIGVLYSPDLSLKLFHTYLGMIFFIIYFGLFMKFFYNRLSQPTNSIKG